MIIMQSDVPARVVFMGTPEFAVPGLRALIETQQVVGVVTQPDRPAGRGNRLRPSPVKVAAEMAGIPVYQPKSLRREEAVETIGVWQPNIIVVAAFGQILRPNVLALPPHGCLNVHASLLPRWRGASPIQHAILAGDACSGISLMQMDEGLDTGPVYVQEAIDIGPRDTAATLQDVLAALGADMLRRFLGDILAGRLLPVPQDDSASTYAPMIRKESGEIEWSRSSLELDRFVRAMNPWPGAYTWWQSDPLRITRAHPAAFDREERTPGEVLRAPGGIIICTADGGLWVEEVLVPGKRAMPAADFANGHPEWVGSVMGRRTN